MTLGRFGVALFISSFVAAAVAQQSGPPQSPAKADTPEIKAMIDQLRMAAGPRWAYAVHFWCEEPRANRPDDPAIPPTKIFDNVFAIGNSGTTVYVIKASSGLLMIDALGGNDAQATTTQIESQLLPGFQKLGLDLQNHMLMDPVQDKLDKLAIRKRGDTNPFVVGVSDYQKFLDVMDGCTRVNLARRRS